jgi:hypothetical protein
MVMQILNSKTVSNTQAKEVYVRPPFSESHVTIIEGDPRQGKTETGVARIRDSFDKDCVRIYCKNNFHIQCEVKSFNRHTRIARIKYNGVIKQFRIPSDYKMHSPMRIFSNTPFYGIPYTFVPSFNHLMLWLKAGVIVNGWLLVDEAQVGMNSRASMTELGRELAKLYHQFGKMQLDVIIVVPMARMVDYLLRTVPNEHIHCNYNESTKKITLSIRKKGVQGEKIVSYYAPEYWGNYDTGRRIVQ